jgi:hypothetical protein
MINYVMELLSSALILISCISIGVCGIFITRNRSGINKHSRQHIKDIQQDMKYLSDTKKEDAIEYRKQILSLKGSLNKLKQTPDFTVKELESGSGIADIIISKFGLGKYKKFLQPYLPQIEKAIIENKDEIINTIKSNNKQTEPGTEDQGIQTL